ncbi:MAG: CAP domain-containing protein [Chloroflexota bacterium]|nr:CAP domain-containing protein [Chloroflexota bacterium]
MTQAENFANPAFSKVWSQTDQAIKQGQASRTWMWGPEPGVALQEAYAESPGGLRLVQYFDKSRMEITKPSADQNSAYYVTNGLLARELVSGWMQSGDARAEMRNPSQEAVGGDPGNSGPAYASFINVASLNNDRRVEQRNGFITESIDRAGKIGTTTTSANLSTYAHYSPELGHNIPDVFYGTFLQWKVSLGLDWVYALGLPITEPYWATFKIGGVEKEILVQIYERRALTFTPSNPPSYLVEMGNIGQHYYRWRYGSTTPTTAPSSTTAIPSSTTAAPPTTTNPSSTTAAPTTTNPSSTTAAPTTTNPSSTTAAPTTTNPSSTTAAPTTTIVPQTGTTPTPTVLATLKLDLEEDLVFQQINQYRLQNGKSALRLDDRLISAARWYSNDMATKNYYTNSHSDSLLRNFSQRLVEFGFTTVPLGESTAHGYATAAEVVSAWKNSVPDNDTLLGSGFNSIGVGRAYNANSDSKYYWTIDFGG